MMKGDIISFIIPYTIILHIYNAIKLWYKQIVICWTTSKADFGYDWTTTWPLLQLQPSNFEYTQISYRNKNKNKNRFKISKLKIKH